MEYHQESGDVDGFEFTFVYSKEGYFVLYQYSNGEPEKPQLVPLNVQGADFEFTLPVRGEFFGKFVGKFTSTGVQGSFKNAPDVNVKLKRGRSYWQR